MNALHPIFEHLFDQYARVGLLPPITAPIDPADANETANGICGLSPEEIAEGNATQEHCR